MTAVWPYRQNSETPSLAVDWQDGDRATIDFSDPGYSFRLRLIRVDDNTVVGLSKTTDITGYATRPNIVIAWAPGDLNIPVGSYKVHLTATLAGNDREMAVGDEPHVQILPTVPSAPVVLPDADAAVATGGATGDIYTKTSSADWAGEWVSRDELAADNAWTDLYAPIGEAEAASALYPSFNTAAVSVVPAGTQTALTIPTYDGSGTVVHPSVVLIDRGWNGYRYWMAFTPYPALNSFYENPSLVASNDGITWVVPAGLTNPIEPAPGPTEYNSDPYLVMAQDGWMYCLWRSFQGSQVGAEERLYYRRSQNGITWGDKTLMMTSDAYARRLVAPSYVQENGGTWRMFAVDIFPSPNTIVTLTAATLNGTWSAPTTCTGVTVGSGLDPWHLDVHRIGGEYVMLVSDTTLGGSAPGDLYRATSTNGVTWTTDALPFPPKLTSGIASGAYKSALLPARVNGRDGYEVYWADLASFSRGFVTLDPARRWQDDPALMAAAGAKITPYVFGDSVNRADSATVPGTATSGHTYTVSAGTAGVASNALYAVTAANTRATVDTGIADGEFGLTLKIPGSGAQQSYLVFRFQDANNYWRFGNFGGVGMLQSIVGGGVSTQVGCAGFGPITANGSRVKVVCSGTSILCYVNDRLVLTQTSSSFQTATSMGFQTQSTVPRFANLYARSTPS